MQDSLGSCNRTIVEKLVSTIKRIVQEMKNAVQRIAGNNAEAAAMLQQDADTLQEIADRFDRLAVAAGTVREAYKATIHTMMVLTSL
ncbi:MAG: hypothetical protein IJ507_08535 [Clostridia bacterium]|nr:hypothetical protein [Clostridia bacterium]